MDASIYPAPPQHDTPGYRQPSSVLDSSVASASDKDADDGLFSSAVLAAAAVTNSPSFGPAQNSPDLNPHAFGIGAYLSPAAWPERASGNKTQMPELGLPPAAKNEPIEDERHLRVALANLKLQKQASEPSNAAGQRSGGVANYEDVYMQQQAQQYQLQQAQQAQAQAYYLSQEQYTTLYPGAPVYVPGSYQMPYRGGGNGGGGGGMGMAPMQDGYRGGGRGPADPYMYGRHPQQQQQQQQPQQQQHQLPYRYARPRGGANGLMPPMQPQQQQQQQQPQWPGVQTGDEYGYAGASNKPRSSLLEELRSAMKAANATARHRVLPGQVVIPPTVNPYGRSATAASMTPNPVPFTLADVRGHAVELAQDQFGSRWLQQQLSSPQVSAEAKQALFEEILPATKELANDTFGNYCVQILLNPSVGRPEQQRALCETAFEGSILELSRNTYACRCIQSLIKVFQLGDGIIPIVRQDKMLRELEGEILTLVTDSNANHVAQQIIERIRPVERIEFILNQFKGHYVELAKDPYGCRVCQRVLENAGPEHVELALEELLAAVDVLVTDSMGNYVVQHIITAAGDKFHVQRARLVEAVKKNLLAFATHKFASNVVEKVLEHGDNKTRRELISIMLEPLPPSPTVPPNTPMLMLMMADLFANYVCQRSLAVADRDQLIRLAQVVRASAPELRRMTFVFCVLFSWR